ncbi:Crp/Fnr family transcriptional regulator [Psychroserpens damuponensis]|uniref:Crp/Fnr family transcriptional regulator n=1 Tax=Psychroserpens damuponensis TaxID=943936 RepID=UPI00058D7901|nr:Crp/Fnr family transcriptional regulator [Psychroserpens damuponensis]
MFNEIFTNISFSEAEIKIIDSVVQKRNYKKGDTIIKVGDVVNDIYFITEGCLRTFYTDDQGKDHTIQFGIKDWWISDFTAFFSLTKAIMTLEVLQDATLFKISRSDRAYLFQTLPSTETHIRKKLESAFAAFQKRTISNLSETVKERYIRFNDEFPHIEKRIKNYHIASYLGITTESLSRIRKELSKN